MQNALSGLTAECAEIPEDKLIKELLVPCPVLIHFPVEENKKSICTSCITRPFKAKNGGVNKDKHLLAFQGDQILDIGGLRGHLEFIEETTSEDFQNRLKFLMAFWMYIDAFKDAVVPVERGEIADWNHFDRIGRSKRFVHKSEELLMEERLSVEPHYRKGHLMVLTSERYVNKRFQSVWRKGTFVKGQAFDVLDDSPAEVAAKP